MLKGILLCTLSVLSATLSQQAGLPLTPQVVTEAVSVDADDPALWINPKNRAKSLLLGTNKAPFPQGALYVYGLDGKIRQILHGIDRPNNVDVGYRFKIEGKTTDIVVLTERLKNRLRVFKIDPDNTLLTDVSDNESLKVMEGEVAERQQPMGIALYRRPQDGAMFAIVAPKTGNTTDYLWQYRLEERENGKVGAKLVRRFGNYSGTKEIEAIAVDTELGYVYYGDERAGIRKWHADPDSPEANKELALFGTTGFQGDREGIGIYKQPQGKGYIVCTDQREGHSAYTLFSRQGEPNNPHDHRRVIGVVQGGADATDGLEVTSTPLPGFPQGLVIAMNSSGKNFFVYAWKPFWESRTNP
jgi:3-phytase